MVASIVCLSVHSSKQGNHYSIFAARRD